MPTSAQKMPVLVLKCSSRRGRCSHRPFSYLWPDTGVSLARHPKALSDREPFLQFFGFFVAFLPYAAGARGPRPPLPIFSRYQLTTLFWPVDRNFSFCVVSHSSDGSPYKRNSQNGRNPSTLIFVCPSHQSTSQHGTFAASFSKSYWSRQVSGFPSSSSVTRKLS